jgi:hypothetical protein
LNARLGSRAGIETDKFVRDHSLLSQFPASGDCAITAGRFESKKPNQDARQWAFYLTLKNGNPIIRYFSFMQDGTLRPNGEFSHIAVSRGRERKNDLLLIGGDHLDETFQAFFRETEL